MAWLVSLKILLISSGVVALALAIKLYVPMLFEFSFSHLPIIWSSCKSLLRPPYLYVVINGIIITIVASSMFNNDRPQAKLPSPESESETIQPEAVYEEEPVMPPVVYEHREEAVMPLVVYENKEEAVIKEVTSVEPINNYADPVAQVYQDREDEHELEVWSATSMTPKSVTKADEIALPAEKPPVSARFSHRKPARSTPEGGRPLRVTKVPKRHDTLENTWRAITEGRAMPLSRHMKKSDTWDQGRGVNVSTELDEDTSAAVLKSKTFKDLTNQQQELTLAVVSSSSPAGSGAKLRKEPSLSQDDLNRRVEAFIRKFNEDMRLQRQESLNQYMEMIKRGSH